MDDDRGDVVSDVIVQFPGQCQALVPSGRLAESPAVGVEGAQPDTDAEGDALSIASVTSGVGGVTVLVAPMATLMAGCGLAGACP